VAELATDPEGVVGPDLEQVLQAGHRDGVVPVDAADQSVFGLELVLVDLA